MSANIRSILYQTIQKLLMEERNLPTVIYFIIIYLNMQISLNISQQIVLYIFSLCLAYVFKFNILFFSTLYISINIWILSILIFIINSLSCTKKWKVYQFVLSMGLSILSDSNTKEPFLIAMSLFMCWKIKKQLVFDTVKQNQQFFKGYFISFVYFTFKYCSNIYEVNLEKKSIYIILLLLVSLVISKKIIENTIINLSEKPLNKLRNSRLIAHNIKLYQSTLSYNSLFKLQYQSHTKACDHPNCFCKRNDKNVSIIQQYIGHKYFQAFQILGNNKETLLQENYVKFLLLNEDVIKALMQVILIKPHTYFEYIMKIKMEGQVKKYIDGATNQLKYQKQYIYAYEYDQLYTNLIIMIKQILEDKVDFWGQSNRSNPLAFRLKQLGIKIVEKMSKANIYFCKIIKQYQKYLNIFDATIMYGLYLFQTTSFKQYGIQIIKNALKRMQQLQIFQTNATQTFAITSFVLQNQKILDDTELFQYDDGTKDDYQNTSFLLKQTQRSLIIDNLSIGLAKMMNKSRSQVIGQQLLNIIPTGYKVIHKIRQKQVYTFDLDYAAKFQKMSPVVHKQRVLPLKISDRQIIMVQVCLKYLVNIQKGLSYVSVAKAANNGSHTCIMGIDGSIYEMENDFCDQVLSHSQFLKYMNKIQLGWQTDHVILQQNFDIMVGNQSYSVIINSPLFGVFVDKKLIPLLHISAANDNQKNKPKQMKNTRICKALLQCTVTQQRTDTQSIQNNNTKSLTSTYIGVVQAFAQKGISSLNIKILIFVILIISVCTAASIITYNVIDLSWDNTKTNYNPIFDIKYALELQRITLAVFTYSLDTFSYESNKKKINESQINYYFNTQNYQEYSSKYFSRMSSKMYEYYFKTWSLSSSHLKTFTNILKNKPITFDVAHYQMNIQNRIQNNMSYYEILNNFCADLNILSYNINSLEILMFYVIDKKFIQLQNSTQLNNYVDDYINIFKIRNIYIQLSIAIIIFILLVPLSVMLNYRLHFQVKIFDLIASIDTRLISQELLKLIQTMNKLKLYQNINSIFQQSKSDSKITYKTKSMTKKQIDFNDSLNVHEKSLIKQSQNKQKSSTYKNATLRQSSSNYQVSQSYITNRKRAGQLDLKDTDNDPDRKIIPINLIFYLMLVGCISFFVGQIIHNNNYFNRIIQIKNKMFQQQNLINLQNLYFLTGKIYLRNGSFNKQLHFSIQDALSTFQEGIKHYPLSNFPDTLQFESEIRNCDQTSIEQYLPFCKDGYTYRGIKQQFFNSMRSLDQAKRKLNLAKLNSSSAQYINTMNSISQNLFFLQSIFNHIQGMNQQFVEFYTNSLLETTKSYKQQKKYILYGSLSWLLISLIISLYLIRHFNKQYIQQVYMITFLNNQMMMNNKRVQSFIKGIEKNS